MTTGGDSRRDLTEHEQPRDAEAGSTIPTAGMGVRGCLGGDTALPILPQAWLPLKGASNKRFPAVIHAGHLERGKENPPTQMATSRCSCLQPRREGGQAISQALLTPLTQRLARSPTAMSHQRRRLCSPRTPFDPPGAGHLLQPSPLVRQGGGTNQPSLFPHPYLVPSLPETPVPP